MYLLVFDSTHAAIAAQIAFERLGLKPHIIPTPREISTGCGMALKFKAETDEEAIEIARSTTDAKGQAHLYRWPTRFLFNL